MSDSAKGKRAHSILIVDDESGIRDVMSAILEDEGYEVYTAEDGIVGLSLLKTEVIDLVLLDVWLPNMGGIDVLKAIKKDWPDMAVVIISGHGNVDLAVKAVKLGAFDFLEKPLSLERVVTIARNALELETLRRENLQLKSVMTFQDEITGRSAAIMRIRELIQQSAASDTRVLITGENGTGKELVAREIHRRSVRNRGPFIELNCAAIPDTLIESELFGHEKGAFTSAVGRRKGKFELAHRGTLFLDEIADMSLNAQAKVLRAIQEMRFERVGGEESVSVDLRLIAATNKDIAAEIKKGRFREDLFFRLNVIPIHVPALRERTEDIPLLVDYFMKKYAGAPGTPERKISPDGMVVLRKYAWPGNVRELKNFVERINIMSDEQEISGETVTHYVGEKKNDGEPEGLLAEFQEMGLNEARDSFEKQYIAHKLKVNGYNVTKTAQALGIYPSNLHGKIRKYGIQIEK
ncbi:MAG TPA: sigma-54 dependent transcriptional regulator [Spirochaetia bacterium]|nr:sigma-54 dependent transcriptional regulator [Spirochaetia bacterium]